MRDESSRRDVEDERYILPLFSFVYNFTNKIGSRIAVRDQRFDVYSLQVNYNLWFL